MILRKHLKRRPKRKKRGLLFFVILLFLFFFGVWPAYNIVQQGRVVTARARLVKSAFKENDLDKTKKEMTQMQSEFATFKREAGKIYWTRFIPVAGWYVGDFKNGMEAADNLIKAGTITIETIEPYADLIGFKKGEASFSDKSADDRIQTAVLTLDKVVVKVDAIAVYVDNARNAAAKINPNRYPGKYGDKLEGYLKQFETTSSLFVDAKPFIKQLPHMLGTEKEKTYLIIFQNDKELRPTGGFMTAYAVFRIRNGKMTADRSEDIYHLDASIPSHPRAPKEILAYHKGVSTFNIRDSNLSPDFVESINLFNSLYDKSSQRVKYDGIIAVDTRVLVDTLEILGDTQAGGITFSSRQDARCDCPQVIYELLNQIDRPVGYIREDRKGLLGQLLFALMQKALGSSPSQYWGKLSQSYIENLNEKHMLMYLIDPETQKAIEAINWAGRIRLFDGDFLHINDTNFAGAKSNLFVTHAIDSDTNIKGGKATRSLIISYKNPKRHSDCNLERGGLCINATLRNWVRIYVPQGSKLISLKGSETPVRTYDELGKTVFEGFMRVNPQGKATVTVEYELPFNVKSEKDYMLLIQKQPGTAGHDYSVSINGKKKADLKLVTDYVYTGK